MNTLHEAIEEDLCHLLTTCRATVNTRTRLLPDLLNTVAKFSPNNEILITDSPALLTQFVLDPTSLNLPNKIRLQPNARFPNEISSMCSNYCFAIHKERIRQLSRLGHIKTVIVLLKL